MQKISPPNVKVKDDHLELGIKPSKSLKPPKQLFSRVLSPWKKF
jgi:hypothetical protein